MLAGGTAEPLSLLGAGGGLATRVTPASMAPPVGPQPEPHRRGEHHGPRDGPQPGHEPRREHPGLLLPGAAGRRRLRDGGQHQVRLGPSQPARGPPAQQGCPRARAAGRPPHPSDDRDSPPCSSNFPKKFSHCSRADMETFVEKPRTACLVDAPDPDRLVGGPVCGNGFLERGEQCDCGAPQVQGQAPPPPSAFCLLPTWGAGPHPQAGATVPDPRAPCARTATPPVLWHQNDWQGS